MPIPDGLKKPLTAVYYQATLPLRKMRNARIFSAGQAPIVVLFYHRIADWPSVPWTHSNQEFQRQMLWLKQRCDLVTLEEAQRRIRSGSNDRLTASITFDDGYAENCDQAIPFLVEQEIPCTYFVSTGFVLEQRAFPHDLKLGLSLPPNTVEQVRAMSDAGIEVAAHTRNHPDMGSLREPWQLEDEFLGGAAELEDMIGRRVRYFAFPYGMPRNMPKNVFRMAIEHGYEAVCSAYGDYNFPGEDEFHIRRFHPDDMVRLRNWLTIDPRKQWWRPQYDYRSNFAEPADLEAVSS